MRLPCCVAGVVLAKQRGSTHSHLLGDYSSCGEKGRSMVQRNIPRDKNPFCNFKGLPGTAIEPITAPRKIACQRMAIVRQHHACHTTSFSYVFMFLLRSLLHTSSFPTSRVWPFLIQTRTSGISLSAWNQKCTFIILRKGTNKKKNYQQHRQSIRTDETKHSTATATPRANTNTNKGRETPTRKRTRRSTPRPECYVRARPSFDGLGRTIKKGSPCCSPRMYTRMYTSLPTRFRPSDRTAT